METSYDIRAELATFTAEKSTKAWIAWEKIDEWGWLASPKDAVDISGATGGKAIGLTVMGITHGNEWAGLAIVNHMMRLMETGVVRPRFACAFVLGNPDAAVENKRFLEKDLNRSFAVTSPSRKEEKRAAELMPILARSARLIDFHQTLRVCDRPFFIFPYSAPSFAFARQVCPEQTIVTHWGKPFSAEGQCTDEYCNAQGGIGISLETGQNGFDPYQIASGVHATSRAIGYLNHLFAGAFWPAEERLPGPIFTFGEVIPWPAAGTVELEPMWDNFTEIKEGQLVGRVDGEELRAPCSGRMIFPKYLTQKQQASLETRPTELCRILKEIQPGDLPG